MAQSFTELPEDVLLWILSLLGVQDILVIEQTCKELQEVVDTRHLWLVKLQELGRCRPPNLSPHVKVEELSCLELRSAVIKAVRWHEACKNGHALSTNTRVSSIRLSRKDYGHFDDLERQFASNGKHFIIKHSKGFDVFCVRTGRRVCHWDDNYAIRALFLSESFTENSLLILLVYGPRENSTALSLVQVDFQTDQTAHVQEVASHRFRGVLFTHAALDGNFAVVCSLRTYNSGIFVWNRQTDWAVEVLLEPANLVGELHIKHGYLFFLFETCEVYELKLGVLPLDRLSRLETSTINFDDVGKFLVAFQLPDISAMAIDTRLDEQSTPEVLCFAFHDASKFGTRQAAEACVVLKVFDPVTKEFHLTARGFDIDFGHTEQGRKRPIICSSFRTSCSVTQNLTLQGYCSPHLTCVRQNDVTGQMIILVGEPGNHMQSYYLAGTDERNRVFFVPLAGSFGRDRYGAERFELCKTSGAIAHSSGTLLRDDVDIHVHYIP